MKKGPLNVFHKTKDYIHSKHKLSASSARTRCPIALPILAHAAYTNEVRRNSPICSILTFVIEENWDGLHSLTQNSNQTRPGQTSKVKA